MAKIRAKLRKTYSAPRMLPSTSRWWGLRVTVSGVVFTAVAMAIPYKGDFRLAPRGGPPVRACPAERRPGPSKIEQGRSDSNAQPAALETAALPIELHPFSQRSEVRKQGFF